MTHTVVCWRCRQRRADVRGAACGECRRVLYACYAVLLRRQRIIPGDERNARVTLLLAAAVG